MLKVMVGRLLAVLMGLAGIALAQSDEPSEFVFAHPGPIRTMDAPVTWFGSTHWLTNTMYDCLIWRAADGNGYVGQAAESWEPISDTIWRFKLREGLEFHNGEVLDADTVKWNIDRVRTREDFLVQPQWQFVKEVVVVDDLTVDIETHEPRAYFEFDVSYNGCQLLPPDYMAEVGEEAFALNPIGSGPYRLVELSLSDRYVFEAWDGYWSGRPEVDRIVYQVIPDAAAQVAALLSGQVDMISNVPVPDRARVTAATGVELLNGPSNRQHLLYARYQMETGMVTDNYPGYESATLDKQIRQAISRALDRELLAEIQGAARPSLLRTDEHHPEHLGQWAGQQAAIDYYDPELARELIIAAGYDLDGGERPVIHLDSMDLQQGNEKEVAEAAAVMLQDVGFDVELNILAASAYSEQILNIGNHRELALAVIGGNPSLTPLFYSCEWETPREKPCLLSEDGSWDALNKEILSTVDLEARLELWEQFWDLYVDAADQITLYHMDQTMGINSDFEWTPRADGWMTFRDLSLR